MIRSRVSRLVGVRIGDPRRLLNSLDFRVRPAAHLITPNWRPPVGWTVLLIVVFVLGANAIPREESTVAELKARIASASVQERAHLCLAIAQKQLDEANKFYAGAEVEKALEPLADVVAYSELARDYSIQSHKNQKQTEIAVRGMTRKLNDLLHTLGHEEQTPVKDALNRLERVRDDLLASMFKKGKK